MPRLGLAHYGYGFDDYPYSSMYAVEGRYSLKQNRYQLSLTTDNRLAKSSDPIAGLARTQDVGRTAWL